MLQDCRVQRTQSPRLILTPAEAGPELKFFPEASRTSVISSTVAKSSASWSMNLPTAFGAWAVIVGLATFYGIRLGYTGRSFALALGVAAALFAFELFLAAPRVLESARHLFGEHGGVLAPLVPLFAVLIYSSASPAIGKRHCSARLTPCCPRFWPPLASGNPPASGKIMLLCC